MTKRLLILSSVLALCLFAVACGDDEEDDSGGGDTGAQTATETETEAGTRGASKAEVSMKDILYKPETVTVKKGATVTWTNDDPFEHTVTYEKGAGKKFDSGNIAAGDTYDRKFDTAGTVDYICTIHPQQKGKVVVE